MGFVQGILIVVLTSLLGVGSCFDLYSTVKYVFRKGDIRPEKSKEPRSGKWLEEVKARKNEMATQLGNVRSEQDKKTQEPLVERSGNKDHLVNETLLPQIKEPLKKVGDIKGLDNKKLHTEAKGGNAIHKNYVDAKSSLKKTSLKGGKSQGEQEDKAVSKDLVGARRSLSKGKEGKTKTKTEMKMPQPETPALTSEGANASKKIQSPQKSVKLSPEKLVVPTDKNMQSVPKIPLKTPDKVPQKMINISEKLETQKKPHPNQPQPM